MYISESQAHDLVTTYKKNAAETQLKSCKFNRAELEAILAQANCEGVIVYMGQNLDGFYANIIAGYDNIKRISGMQLAADSECPKLCDGSDDFPVSA